MTIGELADLAAERGVHPVLLLDGVIRALEDDSRIDLEGAA